jgi:hypothetical protein
MANLAAKTALAMLSATVFDKLPADVTAHGSSIPAEKVKSARRIDRMTEFYTPPPRLETAGWVEEKEGDIDPESAGQAARDEEYGFAPEAGGTPDDAAGESGAAGASASVS